MTRLRIVSRFPRAAVVLEAQRVADTMREAAEALETLASEAHAYEPGTLRREVRAIVLATVAAAVEAEAGE